MKLGFSIMQPSLPHVLLQAHSIHDATHPHTTCCWFVSHIVMDDPTTTLFE